MTDDEVTELKQKQELIEDIKDGYMFTPEEYEKLHYEADSIKKLKETKVRISVSFWKYYYKVDNFWEKLLSG